MRFLVNTDIAQHADVWVEHGTDRIGFRLPVIFKRTQNREGLDIDLYREINAYLKTRSEADQQQLFDLYQEMKQALDKTQILKHSRLTLRHHIKTFYEVLKLEDATHWMRFHSDVAIPGSISDEYVQEDDKPYTRKMTYVRDDYRQLQALVLVLRCMIPVWGHILVKENRQVDTDWRESILYQLLGASALMVCEPMEKLRNYALTLYQSELKKNRDLNDSGIFSGLSSHDFPEWLLGYVVVRKIVVGNIGPSSNDNSHLISSVHNIIISKLSNNSQNFSGLVKRKEETEDSGDDNSKLSSQEKIRKRFQLSDGDLSLMKVVASDIQMARDHAYPWLPIGLLKQAQKAARALPNDHVVHPVQIALAEQILQDRLSVGELDTFTWTVLADNLALAQALAWHRGHYSIAALITARHTDVTGSGFGRMDADKIQALNALFPYHHRVISKQKKEVQRVNNPTLLTIEQVIKDLSEYDWQLTIPDAWLEKIPEIAGIHNRTMQTPFDSRNYLAQLVIDFQTLGVQS